MKIPDTLRQQRLTWLVAAILIGAFIWRSQNPVAHDPEAEKAAQEKQEAEALANELNYEKGFYADDAKDIKEGKYPPTIIRVAAPNGGAITGRWLFIPKCPKGYLCAQPDGTLEDEDGLDWNAPPEHYQQ